jgi:hypothetical protein
MSNGVDTPPAHRRPSLYRALTTALGVLIGAAVGWVVTLPTYRAEGFIELLPRRAWSPMSGGGCAVGWFGPPIAENAPMFDAYVETVAHMVGSPRVVHPALRRIERASTGALDPLDPGRLDTRRHRQTFRISVRYEHTDPDVAADVVGAVMDGYVSQAKANAEVSDRTRREMLERELEAAQSAAAADPANAELSRRVALLRDRLLRLRASQEPGWEGEGTPVAAAAGVQAVTRPDVPTTPANDRRPLHASLGAVAGLLAVLSLGVSVSYLRRSD